MRVLHCNALFPSWSYVTRSLQPTSEDCNIQSTSLSTMYRPEVKLLLGSAAADTHLLGSKVTSSLPYSPVRWLDTCSFSKQTPRLWSSFRETFSCQDLGTPNVETSVFVFYQFLHPNMQEEQRRPTHGKLQTCLLSNLFLLQPPMPSSQQPKTAPSLTFAFSPRPCESLSPTRALPFVPRIHPCTITAEGHPLHKNIK